MDSDEKKPGGGAGGGDDDHSDDRTIDGDFKRYAHDIVLVASDTPNSFATLFGASNVLVEGMKYAILRSGAGGACVPGMPASLTKTGLVIFAPMTDEIDIQRGDAPGPINQTIKLVTNAITIDAGFGGTLTLKAGNSSIKITPMGITIKAPLVQIN
jgi:hypothetical protein